MTSRTKRPGNVLQHIPGAGTGNHCDAFSLTEHYPHCRDLQTRYLNRRFGLDARRARLIALLHFGETK